MAHRRSPNFFATNPPLSSQHGPSKLVRSPFGTTISTNGQHKQWDCVILAVKGYVDMPWFVNTTRVTPAFDIFSYEGNLTCFYEIPRSATSTDSVAVSRIVVACLQFLRRKGLALRAIDSTILCKGGEEYIRKLSSTGQVVDDQDGHMLRCSMSALSEHAPFTSKRMQHALLEVQHIEDLNRHPVTWDHVKDCPLLLDLVTLASGTQMTFGHLIRTVGADGSVNWAVDPDILADSLMIVPGMPVAKYRYHLSRELVRYLRNRIAHYGTGNPRLITRFPTPDKLVMHFNGNVMRDLSYGRSASRKGNQG